MDYRRNGLGSLLVAGADFCLKLCQRVYDWLCGFSGLSIHLRRGVVQGVSVAARADVVLAVGRLVAYEPHRRAARGARLPDQIEHRHLTRRHI